MGDIDVTCPFSLFSFFSWAKHPLQIQQIHLQGNSCDIDLGYIIMHIAIIREFIYHDEWDKAQEYLRKAFFVAFYGFYVGRWMNFEGT